MVVILTIQQKSVRRPEVSFSVFGLRLFGTVAVSVMIICVA